MSYWGVIMASEEMIACQRVNQTSVVFVEVATSKKAVTSGRLPFQVERVVTFQVERVTYQIEKVPYWT